MAWLRVAVLAMVPPVPAAPLRIPYALIPVLMSV